MTTKNYDINKNETSLKARGAYQCDAYASQYAITHVGTQADQMRRHSKGLNSAHSRLLYSIDLKEMEFIRIETF